MGPEAPTAVLCCDMLIGGDIMRKYTPKYIYSQSSERMSSLDFIQYVICKSEFKSEWRTICICCLTEHGMAAIMGGRGCIE